MTTIMFTLSRVLISILFIPVSIIIKRKNVYSFYSSFGYKDSTKFVFERAVDNKFEAYYLLAESEMQGVPEKYKKHTIKINSLKAYYVISRSEILFLTHGLGGLPLNILNIKIIQFWHGIPIKKILLDSKYDTEKFKIQILNRLHNFVYRRRIKLYDHIISTGPKCSEIFSSAFGLNNEKIVELGSPRHEIMRALSKSKKLSKKRCVLYAPTWRDGKCDTLDVLRILENKHFNDFLEKENIKFKIKLHPFEQQKINRELLFVYNKNISIIKEAVDLTDIVNDFDIFVFDYSSAAIDFSITDKNLIFFAPDHTLYESERELYFSLIDMAGDSFCADVIELQKMISDVLIFDKTLSNNIRRLGLVNESNKNEINHALEFALRI